MTPQELNWIKQRQKEYNDLFGRKLQVDFALMAGMVKKHVLKMNPNTELIDRKLEEVLVKYGADINKILDRTYKLHHYSKLKEYKALMEYSKYVIEKRLNVCYAAAKVGRDRTVLYSLVKNKSYDDTNICHS